MKKLFSVICNAFLKYRITVYTESLDRSYIQVRKICSKNGLKHPSFECQLDNTETWIPFSFSLMTLLVLRLLGMTRLVALSFAKARTLFRVLFISSTRSWKCREGLEPS
jgi:hypothetical protein